jgi:hypothetical protein
MMTEPETAAPARQERGDLNAAFEKASSEPRGDWGNVSFRILDDGDGADQENGAEDADER